jgi:hypothetical protein
MLLVFSCISYSRYIVLIMNNFHFISDVSDISSCLSVQLYQYRHCSPSCISWYVLSSGSIFVLIIINVYLLIFQSFLAVFSYLCIRLSLKYLSLISLHTTSYYSFIDKRLAYCRKNRGYRVLCWVCRWVSYDFFIRILDGWVLELMLIQKGNTLWLSDVIFPVFTGCL